MRTKEKLLILGEKSNFLLYKELTFRLNKRLFINKWYIKDLKFNTSKRYNLFDEIVDPLGMDEFISKYKKEMKMVEKICFGNFKRFDLRFEEGQYAMVEYVLGFHLNIIISEFYEEMH